MERALRCAREIEKDEWVRVPYKIIYCLMLVQLLLALIEID